MGMIVGHDYTVGDLGVRVNTSFNPDDRSETVLTFTGKAKQNHKLIIRPFRPDGPDSDREWEFAMSFVKGAAVNLPPIPIPMTLPLVVTCLPLNDMTPVDLPLHPNEI